MVDIVEEEIELHLVDTTQLVEEARKLKEAQKIKKQNDKLQRKLTSSGSPIPFTGGVVPSVERKQSRIGAVKGQKTTNAFKEALKKIKTLEKNQKKAIKKIDNFQENIADRLSTAGSFLNSGSIPAGALGVFGGIASKFGPIGVGIAAIVAFIVPKYFEEFERGGIFSTKLKITEREKNIADIDFVVDVRSGTKFLTSDLRIAQKAPESSNTLNLRYEHIRYVSQELGK